MDHFNRRDGGKILPGWWLREHEFAGLRAWRILAKRLSYLNFPCWHGLCKEAAEPPLGRAGGLNDDSFAWEGQAVAGQGEQDRWRTPS
jgi:hypothetical protein